MYNIYGENTREIIKISKTIKSQNKKKSIIISEFIFCFENEMCQNLVDFFFQRTSRVYFEIEKISYQIKTIKETYKKLKSISEKQFKIEENELKKYIKTITTFI